MTLQALHTAAERRNGAGPLLLLRRRARHRQAATIFRLAAACRLDAAGRPWGSAAGRRMMPFRFVLARTDPDVAPTPSGRWTPATRWRGGLIARSEAALGLFLRTALGLGLLRPGGRLPRACGPRRLRARSARAPRGQRDCGRRSRPAGAPPPRDRARRPAHGREPHVPPRSGCAVPRRSPSAEQPASGVGRLLARTRLLSDREARQAWDHEGLREPGRGVRQEPSRGERPHRRHARTRRGPDRSSGCRRGRPGDRRGGGSRGGGRCGSGRSPGRDFRRRRNSRSGRPRCDRSWRCGSRRRRSRRGGSRSGRSRGRRSRGRRSRGRRSGLRRGHDGRSWHDPRRRRDGGRRYRRPGSRGRDRSGRLRGSRGRLGNRGRLLRREIWASYAMLHLLDNDRLAAAVRETLAHDALLNRTLERKRLRRIESQGLVAAVFRIVHASSNPRAVPVDRFAGPFRRLQMDRLLSRWPNLRLPRSRFRSGKHQPQASRQKCLAGTTFGKGGMYHICPPQSQIQLLG